jgi:hypothetical protein
MLAPNFSDPQSFHDISFLVFRIRVILSGPSARGRRHDSHDDPGFPGRNPKIWRDEKAESRKKKKMPRGSVQLSEISRFGQENPRKTKRFSWFSFAPAWPGFAGFG